MGLILARETGLGCEEEGAVQDGKQVGVPPPTSDQLCQPQSLGVKREA